MLVSFAEAERLALHILKGAGVPPDHAETQAALLLEAELRGRASHGLLRLARVVERTFGWLNRDRILSKSYERRTDTEEAWIKLEANKRDNPLVNRALGAYYVPGSTFKTVVMTAAYLNNMQDSVFSGTPARTRLRTAVRRKSWGTRPRRWARTSSPRWSVAALRQAVSHASS